MKLSDWRRAVEHEAQQVPDAGWALDARRHARRPLRFRWWLGLLCTCAAVFLRLDWSASDIANQLCLAWLLGSSAVLGAVSWNRASAVMGAMSLPVALTVWHLTLPLMGWPMPDPQSPVGTPALGLLVLAGPAALLAAVGAGLTGRFRLP